MNKRSMVRRAATAGIAVFVLAVIAAAQGDNSSRRTVSTADSLAVGSISGRVTLPSGDPVNNRVRITLSSLNDPGLPTYTDNNGNFAFNNLRPGNYGIEVVGDNTLFDPVTEQVLLPRGVSVTVTIALREKGSRSEKKTGGTVVSAAEADPEVPDTARHEYSNAVRLANEGKIEESIVPFRKALSIYPNYLRAHNDLGVQYLKLKRLDEAAEQFEAAIEINPKAFNPRLNLGIVQIKRKNYADALEHLNQAVSLDSSVAAAHLYLGEASLETDELATATRELRTAVSLGGQEYGMAHFFLGRVCLKSGDGEGATQQLQQYLALFPAGEYAAEARRLLQALHQ
jgi:Flp pilus assembly protein TadD